MKGLCGDPISKLHHSSDCATPADVDCVDEQTDYRHPQDNALTSTAAMIRAVWTHSLSGAGHLHTSPRLASVSSLLNLGGHIQNMLHHNRRCHNKSQGNTSSGKSQSGLAATVHYAVVRWDNNVVTVPFVGDEGRARALAARMTSETHKHHVFVRRCSRPSLSSGL